jgi:succinate dehydrogenase / fumarate reductase membrane anchor subunit
MAARTRTGLSHWLAQRATAVALVPLSLWFVAGLVSRTGANYDSAAAWLREPLTAILLALTLIATFYHAALGLGEVIEDYVHAPMVRIISIWLVRFACVGFAVAGLYALIRVAVPA